MTVLPPSVEVLCRQLPGNYTVNCFRRHLRVFWVPPEERKGHFLRAVPTFRKSGNAHFVSFADQLRPPESQGREYTHNETLPNTEYEFGLNHLTGEGVVSVPDRNAEHYEPCICKTPPDVPETPRDLNCHYLHGQEFMCEWSLGEDNGSRIQKHNLQYRSLSAEDNSTTEWADLLTHVDPDPRVNFTLPVRGPTEISLRAVNSVGESDPTFKLIKPPLTAINAFSSKASVVFTYAALSVATFLFLLLLAAVIVYRRRRDFPKGKHPFIISLNRANGGGQIRLLNGSLQDTSLAATKTTSLSGTGGAPMDLSTFEPIWNQELNSLYGNVFSDNSEIYQDMHIPSSRIRFLHYIGCGAFGKVWEGCLQMTEIDGNVRYQKVALKVRNSKSLTEAEFRREAMLMRRYQHENIVRFYGVSLDSPDQQCLVLEMMEQGNLRDYLHKARPRLTSAQAEQISRQEYSARSDRSSRQTNVATSTSLSETTQESGLSISKSGGVELHSLLEMPALIQIMRDVAQGCQYLEEQHFVHRDIAARNCLVSHNHASGRIVKLCDFGLARDVYKNDYYRKRNEPKLPVRWMSPEAILEGLFTSKSDVWAYAVTCWEVMTLGADPFYGQVNLEVINLVLGGTVLARPENCPPALYDHFLQCWSRFPELRPTFADVVKTLDEFLDSAKYPNSPFSGPYIYKVPIGGQSYNQATLSTPTVDLDWTHLGRAVRNDSDVNMLSTGHLSSAKSGLGTVSQQQNTLDSRTSTEYTSGNSRYVRRQTSCPNGAAEPSQDAPTTSPPFIAAGPSVNGPDLACRSYSQTQATPPRRSSSLHRHVSCRADFTTSPPSRIRAGSYGRSGQYQPHPGQQTPKPLQMFSDTSHMRTESAAGYYNRSPLVPCPEGYPVQYPADWTSPRPGLRRQQSDRCQYTNTHNYGDGAGGTSSWRRVDHVSGVLDSQGYERPLGVGTVGVVTYTDPRGLGTPTNPAYAYPLGGQQMPGSPQYAIPARQWNESSSESAHGNYGIMHHSLYLGQQRTPHNPAMFQSAQLDFRRPENVNSS